VDGNRISRLLTGMIDGVQVAVVAGTEVRSSSVDNDTDAQTVTCYVADAPWLPDGVRAGARSTKGAAKHAAGGTVGWSWLDLASRDDSGLVVRARDEQAAEAWLTDRRIQALSSATTVDRALRLVDGAVEIRSKGIESDPATMAMALRAVTGLALALR